tara:strand:- start:851 stop:1102 length:252 start_codon:yes stop_codon:yes gene_type:complete
MQIIPGKQIALNVINNKEISTVELPRLPGDKVVYETCVFPYIGDSKVIDCYDNIEQAHKTHNALVRHEMEHERAQKILQKNNT